MHPGNPSWIHRPHRRRSKPVQPRPVQTPPIGGSGRRIHRHHRIKRHGFSIIPYGPVDELEFNQIPRCRHKGRRPQAVPRLNEVRGRRRPVNDPATCKPAGEIRPDDTKSVASNATVTVYSQGPSPRSSKRPHPNRSTRGTAARRHRPGSPGCPSTGAIVQVRNRRALQGP